MDKFILSQISHRILRNSNESPKETAISRDNISLYRKKKRVRTQSFNHLVKVLEQHFHLLYIKYSFGYEINRALSIFLRSCSFQAPVTLQRISFFETFLRRTRVYRHTESSTMLRIRCCSMLSYARSTGNNFSLTKTALKLLILFLVVEGDVYLVFIVYSTSDRDKRTFELTYVRNNQFTCYSYILRLHTLYTKFTYPSGATGSYKSDCHHLPVQKYTRFHYYDYHDLMNFVATTYLLVTLFVSCTYYASSLLQRCMSRSFLFKRNGGSECLCIRRVAG